ncbi:hypothetical protein ACFLZN_01320, partial [Nanoarchaeota archaeon]
MPNGGGRLSIFPFVILSIIGLVIARFLEGIAFWIVYVLFALLPIFFIILVIFTTFSRNVIDQKYPEVVMHERKENYIMSFIAALGLFLVIPWDWLLALEIAG